MLADALKSLKQGVSRRPIGDADHFWQKPYHDSTFATMSILRETSLHSSEPSKTWIVQARRRLAGAAFFATQPAPTHELKSNPNRPHASAGEMPENSVRP